LSKTPWTDAEAVEVMVTCFDLLLTAFQDPVKLWMTPGHNKFLQMQVEMLNKVLRRSKRENLTMFVQKIKARSSRANELLAQLSHVDLPVD